MTNKQKRILYGLLLNTLDHYKCEMWRYNILPHKKEFLEFWLKDYKSNIDAEIEVFGFVNKKRFEIQIKSGETTFIGEISYKGSKTRYTAESTAWYREVDIKKEAEYETLKKMNNEKHWRGNYSLSDMGRMQVLENSLKRKGYDQQLIEDISPSFYKKVYQDGD